MTNEEMERIMNFLINRQEIFADQMMQSNARMTRLEEAMIALTESQGQTNREVRNLTVVVDRIADAVAVLLDRANGTNGNNQN